MSYISAPLQKTTYLITMKFKGFERYFIGSQSELFLRIKFLNSLKNLTRRKRGLNFVQNKL